MKKLFFNQETVGTEFSIFIQISFKALLMMSFFFFLTSCGDEDEVVKPNVVITGFQPESAGTGEQVHIYGTDFGTSGEIIFGDDMLSPDTWTDTCVYFTVPTGYGDTEQKLGLRINDKDYIAGTISILLRKEVCITPDTYASVGCWSQDGKRIFFIRSVNYEYDIYSVPWTGGDVELVKHVPGNELFLDVSFDNGRFLFGKNSGKPDEPYKIYTADGDLSNVHRLYVTGDAGDPEVERRPAWNNGGGYPFYAWESVDTHNTTTIYVANDSQKEKIGEGYWPRFFPGSSGAAHLAYNVEVDNETIAIVIKTFSGIGSDRDTVVKGKDILYGFDWNVDGRIAYCKKKEGSYVKDIWVINADGSNNHALIATDSDESEPRWSPDGKYLLFTRFTQDFHLYVAYVP